MALVIPAGSVNITWIFGFTGSSVRASCAMACHPTGAIDFGAIAVTSAEAWANNLAAISASSITLSVVNVATAENSIDVPVGVSGEGTAFDNDTYESVVLKKITALKGRAHRGRMYMPGLLPAGSVGIDGSLSPDTVSALQGNVDGFFSDCGQSGPLELLHADEATDSDAILGLIVSPRVGIQRRRRARLL